MKNKLKLLMILLSVFLLGCNSLEKKKISEYSLIRGINYMQNNQLNEAILELENSYKINPQNIVLLKELGYIHYIFGNDDKTEKFWKEGLSLNPRDEELIKNLATFYYQKGRYDETLELIEKNYNKNEEYLLKIKGNIYYNIKDYEKAYEFMSKIDYRKKDSENMRIYLDILDKVDKVWLKKEILDRYYEQYKNDEIYILNYLEILNNNREKEKILLRYLIENEKNDGILVQLIKIYLELENKEKARDVYKLLENKDKFREKYEQLYKMIV